MFFIPALAAKSLAIGSPPETASLLPGHEGLIIGSGVINFLLRNYICSGAISALLPTILLQIYLGLSTDVLGVVAGVLRVSKMAPVEA